ncbi:DEAD/DEAH box helicase [Liquorilactobacillus mali]|uniref:DEAD-box ATP-dependent RNA helicase CshA n=1 Tax=Liquorilactobacillus mali TaxID=1618 RepID=A0A0R2FGG4_9LACO|nr:DEAD/DEAH box helicase [Liquorilactobacillus mali]KRN27310.1 ATP-dependent RNA helicase [Liquorilactobacillus mali]MDN7146004.1 DEAD/DEAH box helicase [Liquorilactobacillus mali]
MKFTELGLSENILKAINRSGFEEATPIQAETIPLVLKGEDVIGQAQTGTGKTAAFGLPILNKIDTKKNEIQAVIVSPTRELAIQTQEELYRLGRDEHAKVQVVYGGADIRRQINSLKKAPQILVGTPGRLLDHIRRRTVKLDSVNVMVLDEADEMLDMGFVEDIESIIKAVPEKRQTLLFSATMPPAILKIGEKFMHKPSVVKIKAKELTTDLVDQYYVRSRDFEKFDVMTRILDVQAPELTIVFGRTKRRVDELSKGLEARGYNAKGIHGDLSQQRRMSILKQFKAGKLDILVATDVAARGLDISGVTHVYNYDIPQDPESYVHRIGRTGRAGHHGVSVTFVTPNEMDYLRVIEKLTKKRMSNLKPPTEQEAFNGQITSAIDDIDDLVKKTDNKKFEKQTSELLEKYDVQDLVAALLNEMTTANEVPVKITPERPLPRHKKASSNHHDRNRRNKGGYQRRDNKSGNYKNSNGRKPKKDQNRDKFNRDNKKKRKFTIRTKEG